MKKTKTAILTLVIFTLFSTTLFAIEYGGIGGVPAYPREDTPRSEEIFIYENAPGSVIEDGVAVMNNTNQTKTILVYATDTTPSSGGGFACKQYAEEVVAEGTWYELEKDEVTIEAGKNEIVPFKVTIPEDVTVGEHNACIVMQEKKEEDTSAGANISVRAAIRAMVIVPGDIIRKLSINDFKYVKTENDKNLINLIVENSGNVSLDTQVDIEIKNYLTSKVFYSSSATYSILHSNKQEFNFDLDNNPWGGVYKAKVTLTYEGNAGTETITKDITFIIVPTIYAMALYATVLIILIASLLLILGRKRKVAVASKNSHKYTVKEGDSIYSIAKDHTVNWELVAKINKMKVPYTVKPGDTILIPLVKDKKEEKKKEEVVMAENTQPEVPTQQVPPTPTPPTPSVSTSEENPPVQPSAPSQENEVNPPQI
jgi:LysM repeat protein